MIRTLAIWLLLVSAAFAQADVRRSKPGWADLGVRLDDPAAEEFVGTRIVEVADESAAHKAGLKAGDLITRFDGRGAPTAEDVMAALWAMDLDRTVKLQIRRGEEALEIEVRTERLDGQKVAGNNNKVHHPPAIRGVPVRGEKLGDGAAHPAVYAFDLSISFAWDLTSQELAQAKSMIEEAARIWFDATEGQMFWRRVVVFTNKEAWERAHYRVRKGRGGYSGVEHVTPGGQCGLTFSRLDRTAAWVFVHEAGHMQLGSGDEYPYGGRGKTCKCLMGGGRAVELCVKDGHDYAQKESCWDNAKRWYPRLVPIAETAKGPELKRLPEIVVHTRDALEERIMKEIDEMLKELREDLAKVVRRALEEKYGKKDSEEPPKRGYLGVGVGELDEEDEAALKKAGYSGGVKVTVQEGRAAEAAGMKDDDIIVEFEGTKVTDVSELAPLVQDHGAEREARVTILRDGKKEELKVKLGVHPEDE
ncbi:MAG: PDZ domain-containing protein [Planctomycetes bacterium]|nr:PDZ domain-containing protein [Planctomycetota bacterium]